MTVLFKKEDLIYIRVPFEYKNTLKRHVKGSLFDYENKCWVAPSSISTYLNIKKMDKTALDTTTLSPDIREWVTNLTRVARRLTELQKGEGAPVTLPEDFEVPIKPFKHQLEAMAFCMNIPKSALWLDLGLGKTFTSILVARMRNRLKQVNKVVIVCPLSLIPQWETEIERFSPEGSFQVVRIEGTISKKNKAINLFLDSDPSKLTYMLVTYESLNSKYIQDNIADLNIDMFILDEATKIKNPKAARTKATIELCKKIPYGIELTGLAYTNNPIDLFSQFLAIDTTVYGHDIWSFMGHYMEFSQTVFGKVLKGFKNMEELKQRAYYIAFSRMKDDCVDLPEKTYSTRYVGLNTEQLKWYDKVVEEVRLSITKVDDSNVTLKPVTIAKMAKLQQLLSGFIYKDDKTELWVGSPKYDELVDIIESSSEQFVVWARHKAVIRKIKEVLDANNIDCQVLNNEVKPDEKQARITKFRAGKTKVVICSIDSESKGLNFTSVGSVNTVYFENTFSVDQRWQSESRIHRIGMNGTATYVDLVTSGTIEEGIIATVKNNLSISEYIARQGMSSFLGQGGLVIKKPVSIKRAKTEKSTRQKNKEVIDIENAEIDDLLMAASADLLGSL